MDSKPSMSAWTRIEDPERARAAGSPRRRAVAPSAALAAAFVSAALLLSSCAKAPDPRAETPAPAPSSAPAPPPSTSPQPEPRGVAAVATVLRAPWSIVFHEGTPIVSERDSARVLELDAAGRAREIATIDGVAPGGEGGLLGIAVHEGHLYAYFTARGENRIERFQLQGRPGGLSLGPAQTVLEGIPAARNHNGGRIAFGPDGMLYATTGDAGDGRSSQNLGSLAGKILRIAPDGSVPADNPFAGSHVYTLGHRNPQGIGWGPDGTMYASEFGQNTWDELNVIEAGGNYGWPVVEGAGGSGGYVDPVQQWPTGEASPSGIAVTDQSIFIANLRGQRLREVPLGDLAASSELFVGEYGRLRDASLAPDSSLWLLTNNTDGRGSPGPDDDLVLRFSLG